MVHDGKRTTEATGMTEISSNSEDRLGLLSDALNEAVVIFRKLDDEGRARLLKTLSTLFGFNNVPEVTNGPRTVSYGEATERFSKEQSLSPKEFLFKKKPRSDVERVACLGYYLAHYRDQQNFKTFDISQINTEAAQTKLSNPAQTVINATNYGYLAQAAKGMRQLSAAGEIFVETLPDREAASEAFTQSRSRKVSKKAQTRKKAID
jgi:hypothetical protein